MAIWEITTAYKKSSIERQFWFKDDKCIIREEGYRWGTFTIESDEKPDVDLVNEYGFEVDSDWELVDMNDGCWADVEKGRNCTDEDLEAFEKAWEEDYYEGVEALGWTLDDSEFELQGPLILKNVDTGEEFSGLIDPATVVQPVQILEEAKPKVELDPSAPWPWGPELANTVETAKWPIDEVEEVEGFTDLTDWYSAEHYYPTNPGRYQVNTNSTDNPNWPFPTFAEWDGKKWNDDKVISWRGLASDPGVTNGN